MMFENLTSPFIWKVTKECADWCRDQHIVHYGNEYLEAMYILIFAIILLAGSHFKQAEDYKKPMEMIAILLIAAYCIYVVKFLM